VSKSKVEPEAPILDVSMSRTIGLYPETDPAYKQLNIYSSKLVTDIYQTKYAYGYHEQEGLPRGRWGATVDRVVNAIYEHDSKGLDAATVAQWAMDRYLWLPGGRILAGAGTGKRVTLMNCYVNETLEDSMESISDSIKNVMLTSQQGGGIGTDFSPLRPKGSLLRRTGSRSSGGVRFMEGYDTMGNIIESAGMRRNAQMGTICDTHPDLLDFVNAKHEKGKLTAFNMSILISDAFMAAVEEDEEWLLYFGVPPFQDNRYPALKEMDFDDEETGERQYVYSVHRARDLWDQILRSTYEYAEPGVIFIDRVNELNNLRYRETIRCTNPCGEQPLPPNGCCNLGHAVLAYMVQKPFQPDAQFDFQMLRDVVSMGVRFLDNVIDTTHYPLESQREEQLRVRRIGLGATGLADAFALLGIRYGSVKSFQLAERIQQTICIAAYETSCDLAEERGPFPDWDADKFFEANGFAVRMLPKSLLDRIRKVGLRNGVLLTYAPVGTGSIAYGNLSGGLEPTFMHEMQRNVTQGDGTRKPYVEYSFSAKLWHTLNPDQPIPTYMNTFEDVKIHEHIRMQEVCQKWVDASISKTINLPKEVSFDEFKGVYSLAYDSGLKGCTTYRPSDLRGSILEAPKDASQTADVGQTKEPAGLLILAPRERPEVLSGRSVKVKWPGLTSSLYLTVNFMEDGTPWEVFFNSKDQRAMEWTTALSLLMSLVLRSGFKLQDLSEEFSQIHALEGGWAEEKYYPSLIAYLGKKIASLSPVWAEEGAIMKTERTELDVVVEREKPLQCVSCHQYTVKVESGCPVCTSCGYSKCS
jgi:ribonucleoside-diphosphate reductase alpha chain